MIMKKIAVIFLTISTIVLFGQTIGNESHFPDLQNKIGKHFPIEDLKNENGEKYKSDYLNGNVTFINFWFTTCEPCLEEMPLLNKLEYQLNSDINFVGITFDTKVKVEKFMLKNSFFSKQITDMSPEMQSLVKRYPMSFIINKDGNIKRIIGIINKDNYEEIKQQILDEK